MADLGTHATLFAADLASPFTSFLRSHFGLPTDSIGGLIAEYRAVQQRSTFNLDMARGGNYR